MAKTPSNDQNRNWVYAYKNFPNKGLPGQSQVAMLVWQTFNLLIHCFLSLT